MTEISPNYTPAETIARDIGQKLAKDIHAACSRNLALVEDHHQKLAVLRQGAASMMAWLAASICETDSGEMGTPDDGPPDGAVWIAACMMARELTAHPDAIAAAYEDVSALSLAGRIAPLAADEQTDDINDAYAQGYSP